MTDPMFITRPELLARMSPGRLETAVRRGELFQVARGIYSTVAPTDQLRLQALHEVRGLVFTGQTAMDLYTDRPVGWPVEARHPGPGRRTTQARIRSGVPGRLRARDGLTVVSPLQAVMDAASPAGHSDFLTEAYAGIGAHDVLERDLAALVTGRRRARELLASTPTGTASRLEQVAFRLVRDALSDLPVTVLTNRMLGNYCYDLLIPEAKVAVEIDSFTFHAVGGAETTPQSFVKQVWKDNEATHLGWLVRHYTEFCIHRAGGYVTSDLHRCVVPRISRGPGVLPDAEEDAVFAWHPIYRQEPWRP
jgi:hypothetical protein